MKRVRFLETLFHLFQLLMNLCRWCFTRTCTSPSTPSSVGFRSPPFASKLPAIREEQRSCHVRSALRLCLLYLVHEISWLLVDRRVLVSSNIVCDVRTSRFDFIGKTLLARTLARVLDVPFSVSDATSFTQVSPYSHFWSSDIINPAPLGGLYVFCLSICIHGLIPRKDVGDDVDTCIQRLVRVHRSLLYLD